MAKYIILGLGSNLGERENNLRRAVTHIKKRLLDEVTESSLYESEPLLPEDAPDGWHIKYLNMAVKGVLKNDTAPQDFLAEIKKIETELGRQPSKHWAPREIDIDILAWGDEFINEPNLNIPHLGLADRDFAAVPFAELHPNWLHKPSGKKISAIARKFKLKKFK